MIAFGSAGFLFGCAQPFVLLSATLFPQSAFATRDGPKERPAGIYHDPYLYGLRGRDEVFRNDCGLTIPSREEWEREMKKDFMPWFKEKFDHYNNLTAHDPEKYKSIVLYFHERFAGNVPTSGLYCHGHGNCQVIMSLAIS
jgi:hypothetical protein